MKHNYNRVYHAGRLVLQVLLEMHQGLVIRLLPSVTLAVAGEYLYFGLSFEWLWGTINVGVMNPGFARQERDRLKREGAIN